MHRIYGVQIDDVAQVACQELLIGFGANHTVHFFQVAVQMLGDLYSAFCVAIVFLCVGKTREPFRGCQKCICDRYDQIPLEDCMGMIDLNCKALVAITQLTLPYMKEGAKIIQLDSLSSFQPVPYINVYGATKAFVLSYSRALNVELKPRKIQVMAVSPGWVETEFFDRATKTSESAVTYYNVVYKSADVVRTALKDLKKGKDLSVHGFQVKAQVLLVKLLPHKLVMKIWMKQQKH